jgi:hypothetical protein
MAVNFAELNELAGELLPERTVLSTVTTPFNNWNPGGGQGGSVDGGGSSSSSAAAASGGEGGGMGFMAAPADHGYQVADACNVNNSPESNSGLLGLFTSAQQNTTSCIPAAGSGSY